MMDSYWSIDPAFWYKCSSMQTLPHVIDVDSFGVYLNFSIPDYASDMLDIARELK